MERFVVTLPNHFHEPLTLGTFFLQLGSEKVCLGRSIAALRNIEYQTRKDPRAPFRSGIKARIEE